MVFVIGIILSIVWMFFGLRWLKKANTRDEDGKKLVSDFDRGFYFYIIIVSGLFLILWPVAIPTYLIVAAGIWAYCWTFDVSWKDMFF